MAIQADADDGSAIAALFGQTESQFGGVDLVIHAAGIMLISPRPRTAASTPAWTTPGRWASDRMRRSHPGSSEL